MIRLLRIVCEVSVWGAALFGVLRIGIAAPHGFDEHSICGPWGCGPPTSALIGWHGFWLLLTALPAGIAIYNLPPRWLRNLGAALVTVGLLILIGIGIWEAATWLPLFSPGEPTYAVQRYLFSLVTMTDVPTIPVALSGIALLIAYRVKRPRHQLAATAQKTAVDITEHPVTLGGTGE